ncbi:MAG: superfamily transporter [Gammaproteobacteria bacterium]|nr:superfamily transporter [Gammaproteobacteria bacterium]
MLQVLRSTLTPLISLIIIILGSSLMTTLLTVKLSHLGVSNLMIGGMSAAFYGGLVLGSFKIEPFIARVGHIRAYAAFASTLAVVSILHGLWLNVWVWLILRLVAGYSIAGLFVVIESWLLERSTVQTRGQVLALYMTALYAGQAAGQLLLNVSDINTLVPFCLITLLCSLSIIPLSITYVKSPALGEPSVLNFLKLYKISPTGVIGSFSSGLVLGAVYGLLPLAMSQFGYSLKEIGWFMGLTILGGTVLQYPIGHVSDRLDRRYVLMIVYWLTLGTSLSLLLLGGSLKFLFAILTFTLGGFAFVLYPLAISHACDYLTPKDIVAATGGLLLAYGIGATLGPLIAPVFMHVLGPRGLFVYFILVAGVMATFIYWRSKVKPSVPLAEQQDFVIATSTTPILNELDPRAADIEQHG